MTQVRIDSDSRAVRKKLKLTKKRLINVEPALEESGLVLIRSISKTFKAGGRPERWKPSRRAELTGGKTLIKTGRLLRSLTKRVESSVLSVGTNVKYSAIHQFGGKINKIVSVKKHWRYMDRAFGKSIPARLVLVPSHKRKMNTVIPARPYLQILDSDWRIIKQIFKDHVLEE